MRLLDTENHRNYYEYVYGTRDIEEVERCMINDYLRNNLPQSSRRCSLLSDCSDLSSSIVSLVRSRFSRSSNSTPRSSFQSERSRTKSESSIEYSKSSITERRHCLRSLSEDSTHIKKSAVTVVTHIVKAEVHEVPTSKRSPVKGSASIKSSTPVRKERDAPKGIAAVLLSPYKQNLLHSVPIQSSQPYTSQSKPQWFYRLYNSHFNNSSQTELNEDYYPLTERQSTPPTKKHLVLPTKEYLAPPTKEYLVPPTKKYSAAPADKLLTPPSPAPDDPTLKRRTFYVSDTVDGAFVFEIDKTESYTISTQFYSKPSRSTTNIRLNKLCYTSDSDWNKPHSSKDPTTRPPQIYCPSSNESSPERDNETSILSKEYRRRSRADHLDTFPGSLQHAYKPPMGRMNPLEDHERKVIIEFCHLLEKSKQLFNGLRELPQYGHKQWHSYFGRTFDVYTKLWKFQQQHREVLDNKYGLQRWQIGEIASKIGQLYYHFYLRTSETAYLQEAFSFYCAIRSRSYYTKACKEDRCELIVKKLRYYARFIVVCLLLKKVQLVRDLIKELDRQIYEYGRTYNPGDQVEWTVVVDEVKAFTQVESVVNVIHPDNFPITLSHRLGSQTSPPVERSSQMCLALHEVLIVGSSTTQVKFSELTLDMYRMLQTLERELVTDVPHLFDDSPGPRFIPTTSAANSKAYNVDSGPRSDNPHKYLLFKPSPSQILVYLASGCNDLVSNGVLLLYISADGQIVQPLKHSDDVGYDSGGLITSSKNDICREYGKDQKGSASKYKEPLCLHPGDLYPFTRRPLFIIVDSDNSYVFQNIPRHFGQPLVVLMSPLEIPTSLHVSAADRRQQGSLFTLFLHSPLTAFCFACDIQTIGLMNWDRAQAYIDTFLIETAQILIRSKIDPMYISFMGDDFLRLLVLRYIFCEVTMRMHRAFRARAHFPRASPPVPDDLLEHPALTHIVMDLSSHLQVRGHFHDPSASIPPTSRE